MNPQVSPWFLRSLFPTNQQKQDEKQSHNIVLSGCGGGYDCFGAIPLFLKLRNSCDTIALVNLSFTAISGSSPSPHIQPLANTNGGYRVDPQISTEYQFPEACLARELNHPVFLICIHEKETISCQDIQDTYKAIFKECFKTAEPAEPDTIILVDGGCDVLLRGDESELGTPLEDIMQLKALVTMKPAIPHFYVAAIGLDCDKGHRVTEEDLSGRLKTLQTHLLAAWMWDAETDTDVQEYIRIVQASHPEYTIVQSLIVATLQGHTGFYLTECLQTRISENKVNLNDRVRTMHFYPGKVIADQNLYLDSLKLTDTLEQVDKRIESFRLQLSH